MVEKWLCRVVVVKAQLAECFGLWNWTRNEVVVDLRCGGWTTWALTSKGKVYGWGKVSTPPSGGVDEVA